MNKANLTARKLYFKNSKGDKLCGILSNPTNDISLPIVILCHGFTTSKDNFTNKSLETILNKKNIATFRFDFFGHGESEGNFPQITVSEGVDDILKAIEFIKSLGYLKISLAGSSFGGITSIMAASKSSDLSVLALKSPGTNYKGMYLLSGKKEELARWKEKGWKDYISKSSGFKNTLNYTFYEDAIKNDGYEAGKKIKIPTIIIHGDRDETVPVEQSIKLNKILSDSQLEIIKGADHRYSNPEDFKKMLDLISNFIFEKFL
jgi:uncharacterized protein